MFFLILRVFSTVLSWTFMTKILSEFLFLGTILVVKNLKGEIEIVFLEKQTEDKINGDIFSWQCLQLAAEDAKHYSYLIIILQRGKINEKRPYKT